MNDKSVASRAWKSQAEIVELLVCRHCGEQRVLPTNVPFCLDCTKYQTIDGELPPFEYK